MADKSKNRNLTEWPGRDVFSDGLPVMGCIRAAEIIPMELKSKIEMLITSDLSARALKKDA